MNLSGERKKQHAYDHVIVGAGPNGLAAAITLARAGKSVLVMEARPTVGGGSRSAELTLPGFMHDICSAIHPLGVASSFFRSTPLDQYGLEWIYPRASLAHPLDDGTAVILERSVQASAESLGPDGQAYRKVMQPLVDQWEKILGDMLGPLPIPPRHPFLMARFGLNAIQPAELFAKIHFKGTRARAVFAGLSAHSMLPLNKPITAGYGLMFGVTTHAVGWPMARGGSQFIVNALAAYLESLGGEIQTCKEIARMQDLPEASSILFDLTPRQLLSIAGERFPETYRRQLKRFRYGPGVFKVDFALSDAIPWKAPEARQAGVAHLGGTLEEVAASEAAVWQGQVAERPFVLLAQQSLFDPTRAPAGRHTAWAYCHVPNGSRVNMTERIEAQIERFAPGFKDCILARSIKFPDDMEAYNPNYVGGDINGGVQDLFQFFTRPAPRLVPYSTPDRRIYICSSSTPPGGGVHGMCGYFAARAVLKNSKL